MSQPRSGPETPEEPEESWKNQELPNPNFLSIFDGITSPEPVEVPLIEPEHKEMTPEDTIMESKIDTSIGTEINKPNENRTITPKEIGINKPTPFDGDRKKVHSFIQECKIYLAINRKVYETDEAKVAFVLSFMTEREALKWKETYLTSITDEAGDINFPNIKAFWELIDEYFKPADRVQDATNKLMILKQGNRPVEDLVTEFRLLASQAGMTDITDADNLHLIRLFRSALHPNLAKKILFSENVPKTFKGWMERAIQYDTNYRMAMAIIGKLPNGPKSFSTSYPKRSNEYRDPNAMDIDAMSAEKRTALMRKGLCFRCEKPGHLARDCPEKKRNSYQYTSQKRTVKEIHALIEGMNKEEKEELASLQILGGNDQDF